MNGIYKCSLWLLMSLSLGMVACSDDEDSPVIQFPELPENQPIVFEVNQAEVLVDGTTNVKITKGAGDYKVVSLNPEIASVSMQDGSLTIAGVKRGKTAILVTDAANQYKSLEVVSKYGAIALEMDPVVVGKKLGHNNTVKIDILKGNGNYKCASETDLFDARIEGEQLVVVAKAEGTANVTLTDETGLTLEVPVTIENTTVPYSQKELAELMANSDTRYYFDGRSSLYYVTHYNFKEGDFNVRGYKWSSNVTLKLFYPGDHSVGKKEGSLITNYVRYSSSNVENHTVDFEIVKNDGKNVWAVFSYVENEKLYYGYLCQPL